MKNEFTESHITLINNVLLSAGWPQLAERVVRACKKQVVKPMHMDHCKCGMAIDGDWSYCPDCGQRVR